MFEIQNNTPYPPNLSQEMHQKILANRDILNHVFIFYKEHGKYPKSSKVKGEFGKNRSSSFKDLVDFQNYLTSNKGVSIYVYRSLGETYMGMLQEVSIVSKNSGKNLCVINEWVIDCVIDNDESLSAVDIYHFDSAEELISFIELNFSIALKDIKLRKKFVDYLISDYDYDKIKPKEFQLIWERFKRDWKSGKLNLKGKVPYEGRSHGF